MAGDELVALIRYAIRNNTDADEIAAVLRENPDVVLRQFGVVDAMKAHGWNERMIGAAMDARYEGME